MSARSCPSPSQSASPAPRSGEALLQALASASTVGGVMAELPCRFLLAPGEGGQWAVVVSAPARDEAHATFVAERSLTAVQRFLLALWTEGVAAVWEPAPLPPDALTDARLGTDQPLGRVWCPEPA